MCAGNHTAFMYMEDDDFLTWEALLSWADDEAPLAALGYIASLPRSGGASSQCNSYHGSAVGWLTRVPV